MVQFGFNFSLNGFGLNGLVYLFFKWFGLNVRMFINGLVWFLFYIKGLVWFQGTETEPGPLLDFTPLTFIGFACFFCNRML